MNRTLTLFTMSTAMSRTCSNIRFHLYRARRHSRLLASHPIERTFITEKKLFVRTIHTCLGRHTNIGKGKNNGLGGRSGRVVCPKCGEPFKAIPSVFGEGMFVLAFITAGKKSHLLPLKLLRDL